MINLSLLGGLLGLGLIAGLLIWINAIKLAKYVITAIIGIVAIIFFWETITGTLLYLAGDLLDTVVEYWGASLLIGVVAIVSLIAYRRSK